MKKIVLVYPRFRYPSGDIPYGIAQVASYLRQGLDAEVLVWDATFNPSHCAFEDFLARTRPAAVGIGVSTVMFGDAVRIAAAARHRGAFVFAGGPHATVLPESLLASENVDAVVMGEGEETTLELMRNFFDGGHRETAGAWIKQGETILRGAPRGFIRDLDALPDPAWDLLPMRAYMKAWYQLDAHDPGLQGTGLIASRGCPFHCSFCQPTLAKIFGDRVRFRSPQRIMSELTALVNAYGIRGFWFFDDSFTVSKKWLLEFCATLKGSGLGLPWGCTTRANLVDEESMTAMAEAGLVRMGIGIESAHPRILDGVYRKGIRVEDAVATLKLARRAPGEDPGLLHAGSSRRDPRGGAGHRGLRCPPGCRRLLVLALRAPPRDRHPR